MGQGIREMILMRNKNINYYLKFAIPEEQFKDLGIAIEQKIVLKDDNKGLINDK